MSARAVTPGAPSLAPLLRSPTTTHEPQPAQVAEPRVRHVPAPPTAAVPQKLPWAVIRGWPLTAARAAGLGVIAATILLELWAAATSYGLRVVADAPTYLSLMREMALKPLQAPTPFLATGGFNTAHATPDMQVLALIWKGLASLGQIPATLVDPTAGYRLLAIKGILATLLVFHAAFLWMRRQAGSNVAWLGIAVLPLIWGPALVISPGDLSFHGFMYGAYHSETLAAALLLYALVALDGELTERRLPLAVAAVAAVVVTHPFTGIRLAALASVMAVVAALRGRESWKLTPPALVMGFALASLWPGYDVSSAMWFAGLNGWELTFGFAALPLLALPFRRRQLGTPRWLSSIRLDTPGAARTLAVLGLVTMIAVALREFSLFPQHDPDALIHTNRTSLYWVTHFGVWPALLGAGLVGVAGLARLARRGRTLPMAWFAGCLLIGSAGAVGAPIPLWQRFLLFAEVPLALGVAVVLREPGRVIGGPGAEVTAVRRWAFAAQFGAVSLVASGLVALGALIATPQDITYLGNPLQSAYYLDRIVPAASGNVVASDPQTEYYLLTTGNRVLTESEWHVGSPGEAAAARAGYRLMHELFSGRSWRAAAQREWQLGVRYVVVNNTLTLSRPTLKQFSSIRPPILRTAADRADLAQYMDRLALIGTRVGELSEFVAFKLDERRVFG